MILPKDVRETRRKFIVDNGLGLTANQVIEAWKKENPKYPLSPKTVYNIRTNAGLTRNGGTYSTKNKVPRHYIRINGKSIGYTHPELTIQYGLLTIIRKDVSPSMLEQVLAYLR